MEPRQRACGEQFAMLLEYMERHGDLAKPQMGAQGRLNAAKMWSELATLLNSVGGGVVKTADKWKKVWADWKTKTKKKHLDIRHHANGTGGGPSSRRCLTAIEERVVAVLGVSAVSGQPSLPELGFNTTKQHVLEYAIGVGDVIVEVPLTLPDSPPLPHPPSAPLPPCSSSPFPPPPFSQLSPPLPHPPSAPLPPCSSSPFPPPPFSQLSPPLPSPPSSYLLPPPPSFLPLSSPQRRHRTPARRRSPSPRRNRGMTPYDRTVQVFGSLEQRRLEFEERRLVLEDEREKRRLVLEDEREKRRLELEERRLVLEDEREKRRLELEERRLEYEERRERRLHERDVLNTEFMQKLTDIGERFLGSSPPPK